MCVCVCVLMEIMIICRFWLPVLNDAGFLQMFEIHDEFKILKCTMSENYHIYFTDTYLALNYAAVFV